VYDSSPLGKSSRDVDHFIVETCIHEDLGTQTVELFLNFGLVYSPVYKFSTKTAAASSDDWYLLVSILICLAELETDKEQVCSKSIKVHAWTRYLQKNIYTDQNHSAATIGEC
jgi:hypothetical protein